MLKVSNVKPSTKGFVTKKLFSQAYEDASPASC